MRGFFVFIGFEQLKIIYKLSYVIYVRYGVSRFKKILFWWQSTANEIYEHFTRIGCLMVSAWGSFSLLTTHD